MHDGVEAPPRVGVAEDQLPQPRPIDVAAGQIFLAEFADDGLVARVAVSPISFI